MVALTDPAQLGAPTAPAAPVKTDKPVAAFLYSVIGGSFIVLWGALILYSGVEVTSGSLALFGGIAFSIGAIEVALGSLVIAFGVLIYLRPQRCTSLGILVIACSIASLIGLGGLLLGFLLGVIGGFRALTYAPTPVAPSTPTRPS